jgi:hypothetical protein
MITVHFNGDVISGANQKQLAEERTMIANKNRVCCYGRDELKCDTWLADCHEKPEIKKITEFGRCSLTHCDKCPLYLMRKKAGNRIKEYKITSGDYRKLSSGAHYLLKTSKHKTVFFTLTFPPLHKKHKLTNSFFLDEISNELFSRFIENLKKTYKCSGYVAVKERGEQNGRTHFHVLASFPFVSLSIINNYWCSVIANYCIYSDHALQTDKKTRIVSKKGYGIFRAIRYICKYFSKAKRYNGTSRSRLIFISNNLLHKTAKITDILPADIIKNYKGIYIQTLEFVTIFRITDQKSFIEFCDQFIYELFSDKMKFEQLKT